MSWRKSDTLNRVVKNAGWIIGCKIVKAVLTVIVTMVTARYLGVARYGLINYAAGIVSFVAPIMRLGLDAIAVHEIVVHPEKEGETIGSIITLCIISSTICLLGIYGFCAVVNGDEPDTIAVCVIYGIVLFFQAIEMLQYWFQAKLLSKYSAVAMLISYILVTIVQVFMLLNHADIRLFALSYSIDFFVIIVILILAYNIKATQKLSFSWRRATDMLAISKYYIISGLMVTVFNNTDRIMLKIMVGDTATGLYAAAHTCASMTSFVFIAIIDSMRSTLFESKNKNQDRFEKLLTSLYSIIIYFSLAQSILVTAFSPIIIRILYGAAYIESSRILRIAIWFSTFSYLGTVRDVWILSEGLQNYLWIINISGAIMNIILNSIMIPLWGPIGAAIASVISQFFTNVITGYIIVRLRRNNQLLLAGLSPHSLITVLKTILFQREY